MEGIRLLAADEEDTTCTGGGVASWSSFSFFTPTVGATNAGDDDDDVDGVHPVLSVFMMGTEAGECRNGWY